VRERGSGTVLAIALIGCVVALLVAILPVSTLVVARHSVEAAADAGALAGADVAVGIQPGYPCEIAAMVVESNGASLAGCEADGLVVTVAASRTLLGISLTAAATAGPAPG